MNQWDFSVGEVKFKGNDVTFPFCCKVYRWPQAFCKPHASLERGPEGEKQHRQPSGPKAQFAEQSQLNSARRNRASHEPSERHHEDYNSQKAARRWRASRGGLLDVTSELRGTGSARQSTCSLNAE